MPIKHPYNILLKPAVGHCFFLVYSYLLVLSWGSKATQSRALNIRESSKNPPNVMASDDDDNNNFVLETLNPFTTLTTILQCLGGLRGWRDLFVNEASGLKIDSRHSVLVLNVRQELNAAVVMFIHTARFLCLEV